MAAQALRAAGGRGAAARRRHAPLGSSPDSDLHTAAGSRVCTRPPTTALPSASAPVFNVLQGPLISYKRNGGHGYKQKKKEG